MLPKCRFLQLLWLVLTVCGLLAFDSDRAEAEEVLASWYGPGFDGDQTASDATFDADGLSAAHKTLPMGTELIVSYHGRSVPVTVNDRGPYLGERELDLSQRAARALGLIKSGVDHVEVNCANRGIYPNCSEGPASTPATTTPNTPPVRETPAISTPAIEVPATEAPGMEAPTTETPVLDPSTTVQSVPEDQIDGGGVYYTVDSDDNLSSIATQLGTSVDHLMAQNGISNPDLIYSDQTLLY